MKSRNHSQREGYKKSLAFIATRSQNRIQPEEIKLLDLSKVVIDGGWPINEYNFKEILAMSGVQAIYSKYQA